MKLEILRKTPKGTTKHPPVLFVHGMCHGAWCWQDQFLPYFAEQGYSAAALSLRGHGASEGRASLRWASIQNYVDDVAQAVKELGTPPILVGHSMGGFIVQKYLETHSAPAAVLLASVPPSGIMGPSLRAAKHHPLLFAKVCLTFSIYPLIHTPALFKQLFLSPSYPDPLAEKYFSLAQDEAFRAYLDMLFFTRVRAKKVTTPLLVMGAADDNAIHVNEVKATARAHGTQAVILPHMGHDMMLETRWQATADGILEWLKNKGM
ncbi:MAG: lysophospholipase [Deltaproteobacteria bacterium]|nr:lysophospholipase [Deltaproteobacteria bacterium]